MILLELSFQGIRSLPGLRRAALGPGLNVCVSSDLRARSAIIDGIYHVMFPDPARGDATAEHVDRDVAEAFVALTYHGRDGGMYRVRRDASSGATRLHRMADSTTLDGMLTDVSLEVGQYLRIQEQLPDAIGYERLFVIARDAMPSSGERARSRSGALFSGRTESSMSPLLPPPLVETKAYAPQADARAPSGSRMGLGGFGSSMNVTNALVQSELEGGSDPERETVREAQLLDRLKEELAVAEQAEKAQEEIDRFAERRLELEQKASRVAELEAEIQSARAGDGSDDSARPALPPDTLERVRRHEEIEQRFVQERARLEGEMFAIGRELEGVGVAPLWKDAPFLAGVIGAIASIAAALYVERPAVALVNLVFALFAGWRSLRWIGISERSWEVFANKSTVEDRIARLERQFAADTASMGRLMKELGVERTAELKELLVEFQEREGRVRDLEERLSLLQRDAVSIEARKELDEIARRADVAEQRVMLGQGLSGSAESIRKRIAALEQPSERRRPSSQPVNVKTPDEPVAAHAVDRSKDLVNVAVDVLQNPIERLSEALAGRMGQYVAAFTDGRFDAVRWTTRSELLLGPRGGGEPIPLRTLAVPDIDLVDSAIRFALVEACVRSYRIPVLIDDPFESFPEQRRALVVRALGYLATATQVIMFTSRKDLAGNRFEL